MKKILGLLICLLALCSTAAQAVKIGGEETTTIKIQTSGEASPYIILESCYIGNYKNVCSVFSVIKNNKQIGKLGNSKKNSNTLRINLEPNKTYTLQVAYDKSATEAWWISANGSKKMPQSENAVCWNVISTHGLIKYQRTTAQFSNQPWIYANDSSKQKKTNKISRSSKKANKPKHSSNEANPFDVDLEVKPYDSRGKG